MTESLELLNDLLRPGPTTFSGEFFDLTDFELDPEVVQTPRPPMFVGGKSDQAFDRATRIADGWNPPAGCSVSKLAEFADRFRAESDGRFVVGTEGTVVREDEAEARTAGKEFVVAQKKPIFEAEESPYADSYNGFDEFAATLEWDFQGYVDGGTFLAGTPDECIDRLTAIRDATDCDEVIFRVSAPGLAESGTTETIELLGNEVLPSF